MADNFKARVDRVFGSLFHSLSNPGSQASWSLSDEAVERKEWNRDSNSPEREETPCSSSFDGFMRKSSKGSMNFRKELAGESDDLDDDEEDDSERGKHDSSGSSANCDDYEKEDWEIRSFVGLDSTLDREEEEDAYDKVAVGRENAGERLYMRDATDYGPYLNSHNVIPESWEEIRNTGRDPRANHLAARARLKEDEAAAGHFDSPQTRSDEESAFADTRAKIIEDNSNVKSILKRKANQNDLKPRKRVRFDLGCNDDPDGVLEQPHDSSALTVSMETTEATGPTSSVSEETPGVPDYIRNPSKYIHYTFDSGSEDDDESNLCAFRDFCKTVNAATCAQVRPDCAVGLPKSVTFTPRKKVDGARTEIDSSETRPNYESSHKESEKVVCPVGIAAGEAKEGEACAMEEDEPELPRIVDGNGSRKLDRQYRTKVRSDDSVS